MAFNYEIIKRITTLSEKENVSKQVNVISYNNAKPKIDIRNWYDGEMRKGITLDEDEWRALGSCFGSENEKENEELGIFAHWINKVNIENIGLNLEEEIDFDVNTERKEIVYNVTFELEKSKAESTIEFLNDANRYFSNHDMHTNAFVEFNGEGDLLKIIGRVPFVACRTEELLDAFYDFLVYYADVINEIAKESVRQLNFEDIIVISDKLACVHSAHNKEELLIAIDFRCQDDSVKRIVAKACYCRDCNLYFMRKYDYQQIKLEAKNAVMLCQEVTEEKYIRNPNIKYDLSDESILHKFGYNVSDGMSDKNRRAILSMIIDRKILSKENIAWRLAGYVRMRMYDKEKFKSAIEKWNRDRDFVLDYDIDSRRKVEPQKIVVIKYQPEK